MSLFIQSGKIGEHEEVEDNPDFTAMIDMTFILLAFFVVTSTMEVSSSLTLPPARSGDGLRDQSTVLSIYYDGENPVVYLGDSRETPATMSEVTAFVSAGIAEQKLLVLIKADRETPSGFVEDVARAAGRADGVEGYFVAVRDYSM